MAIVVQGFAVFLAALFSLAAGHKARVLLAGRAEREPLLRRLHRSSAGAQALLVVGLLAEVLAAVLLILATRTGLLVAGGLLIGYQMMLRGLERHESCQCFGPALGSAQRGKAMVRNWILIVMATAGAAALFLKDGGESVVSPESFALAAVPACIVAAIEVLRRNFPPKPLDTVEKEWR